LKILIIGGSKSGKSMLAQKLTQKLRCGKLFYIATMKPHDSEDFQRIKRHINEREGYGFETLEQSEHIAECIKYTTAQDTVLIDSLTSLLANEMFNGENINADAFKTVADDVKQLCSAVCNAVMVSDYIFSDAMIFEDLTQSYKRGLSLINRKTAEYCDIVLEMNNSNCTCHKGKELFLELYEKIV
jgi:adenosylcobinamide kinase/adenosylcobinamide-phosphate guanylyltransferase